MAGFEAARRAGLSRAAAIAALAFAPLVAAAAGMPGRAGVALEQPPVALRVEAPAERYRWDSPLPKAAQAAGEWRVQVGRVRAAPKDFSPPAWQPVAGGFVARFDVASAGALGLRARLDLAGAPALEMRVRGEDGRVERMAIAAGEGAAWGPWTPGAAQAVEVFAAAMPPAGAVRVGGVVHFDQPLGAKLAGACTMDTPCTTGDTVLDAAIAERKMSLARISFVEGGKSYVCSGTLVDSEKFPTPYFLTANHCIGSAAAAGTITSLWFFEATGCSTGAVASTSRQVAGGMTLDFTDPNTDQTLLVMKNPPPAGAAYSGWDAARLVAGTSGVSLSHPSGDVSKWALGDIRGSARFQGWEQSAWVVAYSKGIIEGGSSGSGFFTLSGGKLTLRAVLSATTVGPNGGLSCTNLDQYGVYNRLDVFYPEVARRLLASPPPVTDDHGDRITEATPVALGAGETVVTGRIDYAGDTDVFRIPVTSEGTLIVRASGGLDTVGVLMDSEGLRLESNDDAQTNSTDFGLTWRVSPGTYYLAVTRWESAGTGPYSLAFSMSTVTDNYTDLWWNPAESGWGVNFNHQGQTIFATLFTYGADGAPDWFVMSDGARQADGSFRGKLYRATGPAFDASPWGGVALAEVGTMQVAFPTTGTGTLTYSVDGVTVTKSIERQRFSTPPDCSWSAFDRSYAWNYQDLWWNPSEPGWGINFAHQGDILFATLFTYAPGGRSQWFVMSKGDLVAGTSTYEGPLYRATGPAFNASPWGAIALASVGTMSVTFTTGNAATLVYTVDGVSVTKTLSRQVFGTPATECRAADG